MDRRDVILRAALPFAGLNLLLWWAFREESATLVMAFPFLSFWLGQRALRRAEATWTETVWAFVAGMAPLLLVEPILVFSVLVYGGAGFWLLPLCSKVARENAEIALPPRSVWASAAGILAGLLLIVSHYVPFHDAIVFVFLIHLQFFPASAGIAIALTLAGQRRSGAWVGAIAAASLWASFALLFLGLAR